MTQEEIINGLKAPFPFWEIEWKPQVAKKDNSQVLAVPYVDSRAIQNRLDKVVGPFNWITDFKIWHPNSQLCSIAIYDEEKKIWIEKQDGAGNTAIEAVKGGLSDAMKRAAVQWGIGRYLYNIDDIWVKAEPVSYTNLKLPTNSSV